MLPGAVEIGVAVIEPDAIELAVELALIEEGPPGPRTTGPD